MNCLYLSSYPESMYSVKVDPIKSVTSGKKYLFNIGFKRLCKRVLSIGTAGLLLIGVCTQAAAAISADATLAAPIEFDAKLFPTNTLELSWNPNLISGEIATRFEIYNGDVQIGSTTLSEWTFSVSRSRNYDLSVLAVTSSGESTRRSNRIYIDLPPADRSWDGGNRYLPPLTGLTAQISGSTSAEFTWDEAPAHWRPSETTPYSYTIWINGSLVEISNEASWSYSDFEPNTITWVGIRAQTIDDYVGRQMTFVAVDTRQDIGSMFKGYPGFPPVNGFRADAYSANSFELFWDRNNDVQSVYIDGRLVTRTEGTSYFYTDEDLGNTVQVAVGRAWPTLDNGHDSLLNIFDIELPSATGTGGDEYTDDSGDGSGVDVITVRDGSIELPNDGWYQVQDASSYATICEGALFCETPSGRYVVINHTTGERFENIVVSGSATDGGTSPTDAKGVVVNGNTLSWPDDGWYQVQDATDFSTVCEGGQSCEVSAGTYIVINHSDGNRYDNIQVRGSDGSEDPSSGSGSGSVEVNGLTVSWPADGWYQLQRASDYSTVCQGGLSCDVDNGSYILINHTTGERFDIEVSESHGAESTTADANQSNAEALIRQAFEVITVSAYDERLFSSSPLDTSTAGLTLVDTINVDASQQTRRYSCFNGGTVEETYTSFYSDEWSYRTTYDNCQIAGDTINGLAIYSDTIGGNYSYSFDNYRLSFEPSGAMAIDGAFTRIATFRPSYIVQQNSITSTLQYTFEYPLGSLEVSQNNTDYRYLVTRRCCSIEDSAVYRNLSASSSFVMKPPFSDESFRVTILSEMTKPSEEDGVYFNMGSMRITSMNDGSYLTLDADTGNLSTARVTVEDATTDYEWTTWSSVFCTQIVSSVQQQDCEAGP